MSVWRFFITLGKGRFLILLLFVSCGQQEEIRLLFTGDILLSRQVKKAYEISRTSPWEDFKPLFQTADLVIGNLEGAVGTVTETMDQSDAPFFAIDSADISLLADAGFKVMGIENNHSYDLGEVGRQNTIDQLLKNEIHPVGFTHSPYFISVKGLVLSFVAINTVPGRNTFNNPMYSLELQQKIRLAKSLSNIVVVSIHWGSELLEWPNKTQREAAKWLITQGADIIIGSHPHVVQAPEMIDGKPVFFSLGNHLFDQKYPATKKGLIAEVTIKKGKYNVKGITTHTKPHSFYPVAVETVDYNFPNHTYHQHPLRIHEYDLVPVSVFERNETKVVLRGYANNRLQWSSFPMPLVYLTTAQLDGKETYLFALQNYYSTIDTEINLRPYVYAVDAQGLHAKWRGSALAHPLLDAFISPHNDRILCALHRGDAYIALNEKNTQTRIAAYEWNGFGFKGLPDSIATQYCPCK